MTIRGHVSMKKAAMILGVSVVALKRYHDQGRIGFVKVGRQWRTSYGELDRFKREWLEATDKERKENDAQPIRPSRTTSGK